MASRGPFSLAWSCSCCRKLHMTNLAGCACASKSSTNLNHQFPNAKDCASAGKTYTPPAEFCLEPKQMLHYIMIILYIIISKRFKWEILQTHCWGCHANLVSIRTYRKGCNGTSFGNIKTQHMTKMDVQEEANYLDWSYLTYVICARFAMLWTWGISFKFWHFLNPLCAPQKAMLGLWPIWPINHENLQFWPN